MQMVSEEVMAGGMDWFRWHHGTVNDPKFRLVARRASVRVGDVIALWGLLLEQASANSDRGHPGTVDWEAVDLALDLPDGGTQAIFAAMVDRKLIDAGTGRIARWEARQPKREDSTAAERKRLQRERDAAGRIVTDGDVTQGHAEDGASHAESLQKRGEEKREEDSSLRSESMGAAQAPVAPAAHAAASEPGTKSKRRSKAKPKGYTEDFEAAWAAYPRRPGDSKADAFKAYSARIAAGATAEQILAGVLRYAAYAEVKVSDPTFLKQGATFFGPGRHFEAGWEIPAAPPKPVAAPAAPPVTTASRAAEATREMLDRQSQRGHTAPSPEQRAALDRVRQKAAGKVHA